MSNFKPIVAALTVVALCGMLPAQDPFGGGDTSDDAFATTAATPSNSKAGDSATSYLATDPLILRIRENPPKTPTEMANAISWMVKMRSWEQVGGLLDRLAAANWSVSARAETARAIEPAIWSVLLKSSGKLKESQSKALNSLYGAPVEHARTPAVIDAYIDRLASSDANDRRLAQLRLHDGQMNSLKRLLERLLDSDPKVPANHIAATIAQFDIDGVDALRAACCLQDAVKRSRVLVSVAELTENKLGLEVAAALHSSSVPANAKAEIADKLRRRSIAVPDKNVTIEHLDKAFKEALGTYQLNRGRISPLTTTVWQPNKDGRLVAHQMTQEIADLERLTQLSCLRAEMEGANAATQLQSTVIQLQRAYQLNPKLSDPEVESLLMRTVPDEIGNEQNFWIEVFKYCSKQQMHGAAVRSLQMMTSKIQSGKMLAPMSFLSELFTDNRPVIRYLALEAVSVADPRNDYSGSSQALSLAVEMTQLAVGPQALVVGANAELCMSADEIIQQHTSTRSVIAKSGREAFSALSKQNPVEWIVVADRVQDLSLYELLQRLRNSSSLPIAVLVDNLSQSESNLIGKLAGVYASNLSRDPEHMRIVIEKSMQSLDVRPMSMEDRTRFAAVAGTFITRITSNRELYGFYPIDQWNQQLISSRKSLSPAAQAQVLSALGNKDSQIQLVVLASTTGAMEADRIAAAKSFNKSVKQFGLQLNDQHIKDTYQLYNQLGPNDPSVAKALGHMLDVIEAQAGAKNWPDPLAN